MYLDGPGSRDIVAVLGLLDLYGPDFYPEGKKTVRERYEWGVHHFEQKVGRDRFRMFFAVHEFEAWLLSDPEIFPRGVRNALPPKIARPEEVDFEEPPAKLLERVYKQATRRGYKKTTYGEQLFGKLAPATAVSKCPYLKAMAEEMHRLAAKAQQ